MKKSIVGFVAALAVLIIYRLVFFGGNPPTTEPATEVIFFHAQYDVPNNWQLEQYLLDKCKDCRSYGSNACLVGYSLVVSINNTELENPVSCKLIVDNITQDKNFGGLLQRYYMGLINMTTSHSFSLCCESSCKTAELPAKCV